MNYFTRAIKYFLSLCILYLAVIYGMWSLGFSALTPHEAFEVLLGSSRGIIMIVAVVSLSLAYPVFGFMKQEVTGDMKLHREKILEAMLANGFTLKAEGEGEMLFENNNLLKRITFLFENKITVTQVGDKLVVEGIRRAVPFVIYRLEGAISFSAEEQKEEE